MQPIDPSAFKRRADETLQDAAYDPKKIVLLHTCVALGSSLLVTLVNLLLSRQIADTGGLAGMGLRSVLATTQSVLEFVVMVILPFWEVGIIFAALRWARKEEAGPRTLLQGFLRFRSVLGLNLLRGLLFLFLGVTIFYFSFAIFMLTPLADPLMELLEPIASGTMTSQDMESLLTPELLESMRTVCLPMIGIWAVLYAIVAIPVFYRLRFAEYAMADGAGAIKSLLLSLHMTKKKSLRLFRVDLYFWWYYLVLVLLSAVSFADVILTKLGIVLPFSGDAGSVVFCLLAIAGQVAFCCRYQPSVSTTYALTYEEFRQKQSATPPQPKPANVPWNTC